MNSHSSNHQCCLKNYMPGELITYIIDGNEYTGLIHTTTITKKDITLYIRRKFMLGTLNMDPIEDIVIINRIN